VTTFERSPTGAARANSYRMSTQYESPDGAMNTWVDEAFARSAITAMIVVDQHASPTKPSSSTCLTVPLQARRGGCAGAMTGPRSP
jgi:hypothetical protein